MSQQSKYGAVEAEAPASAATPRRARGVVLALALCAGGALFAVAGPGPSPPVWKSTSVGCTRQFFTKSFLGDGAADLARSSGEEPASPRHRAGVASIDGERAVKF